MKQYAFGVDIGGTTVKIGLFHTEGTLLKSWEIPTRKENRGEAILPDIAESVKRSVQERGLRTADVAGIGMGIPGPVLNEATVNCCVNLGWGVVDVAKKMRELTGVATIKAGNDANVAALGEMWQGGGKGYENLVMVTLGTGVGGGIIAGGRILPGVNGAGGEIGHICVSKTETESCGCGNKGCLEQYASARGIVRTANELLKQKNDPSKLRSLSAFTTRQVFAAAKEGDAIACEAVEAAGEMLGIALAGIACVVDPQVFVIGGGVSRAGQMLLDVIQKHYRRHAFHASRNTGFCLARLGNDAGMYGAVKLVVEEAGAGPT